MAVPRDAGELRASGPKDLGRMKRNERREGCVALVIEDQEPDSSVDELFPFEIEALRVVRMI